MIVLPGNISNQVVLRTPQVGKVLQANDYVSSKSVGNLIVKNAHFRERCIFSFKCIISEKADVVAYALVKLHKNAPPLIW